MSTEPQREIETVLPIGNLSLDLRRCFGLVDEICNAIVGLNALRARLDDLAGQFLGALEEKNSRTDRLEALLISGLLSDMKEGRQ
jgi:hypothetical protein